VNNALHGKIVRTKINLHKIFKKKELQHVSLSRIVTLLEIGEIDTVYYASIGADNIRITRYCCGVAAEIFY
jgi:hypothetical protein